MNREKRRESEEVLLEEGMRLCYELAMRGVRNLSDIEIDNYKKKLRANNEALRQVYNENYNDFLREFPYA
jgi:hypothetical protein